MRRNSLLAAGMLSVLLATSACGSVTGALNSPAQSSESASAGIEASSSEVGASQRAAAEKAAKAAEAGKAVAAAEAEKAAAAAETEKTEKAAAAEKVAKDEAAAPATAQQEAAKAQAAAKAPVAAVPVPAAALPAAPKAAPAPAPVLPQSSNERIVNTTYTTAYTWYDNTPAGTTAISHPVLHKTAGGTGTFEDPITIAVGHSLATGQDVLDFPAGTKVYLPDVRRYFIVEDTCGDGNDPQGGPCHQGVNANGTNSSIWIDMWIGGQSMNASGANGCASKVTNVNTAVFNPASNYVVAPGAGVIHDGKCDAGYGNALVKQ